MKGTNSRGMLCSSLLLLFYPLAVSTVTITSERGDDGTSGRKSATLLLLTGYKPPLPAGPKVAPKAAEVAELPPKPLPQTMLPRNMTAEALKPPLGAAQVAPPPRQLVDVDVCRSVPVHFCFGDV